MCTCEPMVKRHQLCIQQLGNGHVPGIVSGQVGPELPYPLRERRIGIKPDPQLQQVSVRLRSSILTYLTSNGTSPQNIGGLRMNQVRTCQLMVLQLCCCPLARCPGISQHRDCRRRIDHPELHFLSASRCPRMSSGPSSLPVS